MKCKWLYCLNRSLGTIWAPTLVFDFFPARRWHPPPSSVQELWTIGPYPHVDAMEYYKTQCTGVYALYYSTPWVLWSAMKHSGWYAVHFSSVWVIWDALQFTVGDMEFRCGWYAVEWGWYGAHTALTSLWYGVLIVQCRGPTLWVICSALKR